MPHYPFFVSQLISEKYVGLFNNIYSTYRNFQLNCNYVPIMLKTTFKHELKIKISSLTHNKLTIKQNISDNIYNIFFFCYVYEKI